MPKKYICVVTGTRAEYGPLKLIIKKIIKSENLNLYFLVTGMHLLKRFGYTIEEIKEDKIPITKIIPMYDENKADLNSLGKAVGRAITNFTEELSNLKPNILLVAGDRYESLAAVISATTLSIPIAHIQGGDNNPYGQLDESIRHSITKFAHIHFPATPNSAQRIKLMGEEDWRINMVGAIALDMIYNENLMDKEKISKKLGLDPYNKIVLCIQHPYVFESEKAGDQMELTLQVLKDLNLHTVIIYPNNDPGSDLIIEKIKKFKEFSNFKVFKNLPRTDFLSLFKNVDLLIGNSSSGCIEAPTFKVPVVNIGFRNKAREKAENAINVTHNYKEIQEAIKKAFSTEFKTVCQNVKNPYGEGNASDKIVKKLEELVELDNNQLINKKIRFRI